MGGIFFNVNGCCGCFSLRTGTSIILWLNTVVYGIFSLVLLGLLIGPDYGQNANTALLYSLLLGVFVYIVMFSFIPNVLGLYAIFERKPSFLRIYVILRVYDLACMLATVVFFVLLYITHGDLLQKLIDTQIVEITDGRLTNGHRTDTSAAFYVAQKVSGVILTGLIQLYFTSVVHHYYLKLKAEENSSYQAGYVLPPK